ncbi:hypothetical protein PIB30_032838 [Stylosanthes scabra]|uniref:Uncharacterized protein n=1 Tax=Stylosanthes scabra TaxID=79078 RepID=A0ABU6ZA20_9FABA|nr:hypothetical protein [Stylosanthes scabra]
MAYAPVIELYVEFEQIPYVVGAVEEVQPDLTFEGYYSNSEEEFEDNYEIQDANEEDVLEHDTESEVADVANTLLMNFLSKNHPSYVANTLANELPFQEPSFMRVLDEDALNAPEFAEDMNPALQHLHGVPTVITDGHLDATCTDG